MRYKIKEDVLWKEVDGEAVMVDPEKDEYCYLNTVGTGIWNFISEGKTLKEIEKSLIEEYEAPSDEILIGLKKLIKHLVEKELIELTDK